MRVKKIASKAKIGVIFIREYGFLSFGIKSLNYVQKRKYKNLSDPSTKSKISIKVKHRDVLGAYKTKSKWVGSSKNKLEINWIMPPPGKGSGGHLNIFRFIQYLEKRGHINRIYLYADGGNTPMNVIKEIMGDSYPKVLAEMTWINDPNDMKNSDIIFCTSWETAYASKSSSLNSKRFYFVQDYEPYFYPVGSLYSLAKNTYDFGFYGITAGGWLSKKLSAEHDMGTDYYNFGTDSSIYKFQNTKKREEILFYARPFTERRGFEMGILALEIFHQKHPEIIINFAGWDVSEYDIPFPYKNLKTLEIDELCGLYNRCCAGLLLSYTNMSLLPLELLACGTIPVVNDGDNNRLVSDNTFIAYTGNTPIELAKSLSEVIVRKKAAKYAEEAAASVKLASWDESGRKFVEIIEREVRKNG